MLNYSTVSPILPGQMRVWQNGLGNMAIWMEHSNQSQPKPGPRANGSPCTCSYAALLRSSACSMSGEINYQSTFSSERSE